MSNNLNLWIKGARPKTLGAAIVPVAVGSGIAFDALDSASGFSWGRFGLALAVALSIQIAVNYANDYSDGKRGLDAVNVRQGPIRLVGAGLKSPKAVLAAALIFFAIAMICGLVLSVIAGYILLIFGAVALLAAWTYTGGPWPYGYKALGEISVFVFFGLFATVGTSYVIVEELLLQSWLSGAGLGVMSAAILIANNFRDIKGDKEAGKKTLAVVLGARGTQILYWLMFLAAGILSLAQMWINVWSGLATLGLFLGFIPFKNLAKPNLGRAVLSLYGYGLGLALFYWI